MTLTQRQATAIANSLTPIRLSTYQSAKGFSAKTTGFEIYVWNAIISGAFFSSLHICEVVIRNGIASALESKYGPDWPWNAGFEQTLTTERKNDLRRAREGIPKGSTGKVIAEMKFFFWCKMFTVRHDPHLWNSTLRIAFPFLPYPLTTAAARTRLYDDMEVLRVFRNRIAHHEPIFSYPLDEHHRRISRLIKWRCGETAQWLAQWEVVTAALADRP